MSAISDHHQPTCFDAVFPEMQGQAEEPEPICGNSVVAFNGMWPNGQVRLVTLYASIIINFPCLLDTDIPLQFWHCSSTQESQTCPETVGELHKPPVT